MPVQITILKARLARKVGKAMGDVTALIRFEYPQRLTFSHPYESTQNNVKQWRSFEFAEAEGVTVLTLRGVRVFEGKEGPFIMPDVNLPASVKDELLSLGVAALVAARNEAQQQQQPQVTTSARPAASVGAR